MVPRDLNAPELLQMWREPLRIEQDKLAGTQVFHERNQGNLGCISYAMKH